MCRRTLWTAGLSVLAMLGVTPHAGAARIDGSPLTIFADGVGHLQVRFTGEAVGELEPAALELSSGSGMLLLVNNGTPCGPGGNEATNAAPATTSGAGTAASPFAITTDYVCSSSLAVHEVFEYINGQAELVTRYTVTNTGAGAVPFRATVWGNLHHGQTSLGRGFFDGAAPRVVGGYNDAQGSEAGLIEEPGSAWNGYMEAEAPRLFGVAGGLFGPAGANDTVDPSLTDDAVAVQFDTYTSFGLPAGGAYTFAARWFFGRYDGLALDPPSVRRTVGEAAPLTVTSLNHGRPVAGATVRYTRSGANSGGGAVQTRADGTATIALTAGNAGAETITAYVDTDGDGVEGPGETRATATIDWAAAAVDAVAPPAGGTTAAPTVHAPVAADLTGALRSGLASALAALKRSRAGSLGRRHRVAFVFPAPVPGRLGARITAGTGNVVLARATHAFGSAGMAEVTLRLTPAGVRALRVARRLRATLTLTFAPSGAAAVTARRSVTLRR